MSTYKERYAERQKQRENQGVGSSYKDRYLARSIESGKLDIESIGNEISERVNTWLKNNENYFGNANNRFADNTSYRADTSDWLSTATNQHSSFQAEAERIKYMLDQYKGFFSEDYVSSVTKALDDNLKAHETILSNYTKDHEYWSQWENEDLYKRDMADWLEDDAEYSEEKVAARQELYQSNANRLEEIEKEQKDIGFGSRLLDALNDIGVTIFGKSEDSERIDALRDEEESLSAENRRYDREQKALDDYFVPETEEFLQNASYREYSNPTIDDVEAYWSSLDFSPTMPEDKLGFYLNGYIPLLEEIESRQKDAWSRGEDYRTTIPAEYVATYHEGADGSWDQLKENEINIYYDLYKREGQQAAYDFLDAMKTTLNKRATQEMVDDVSDAPVLEQIFYNVASVPANVLGGAVSFVDDAANIIRGDDINPYSSAHRMQNFAQAVRQDTANDINKDTGNAALPYVGTTWGDVYQAIMSGADSFVGAYTLGGTGYGILMGMGAASSEARELYEKGASLGQIAAGGVLAGAAEMVFEKYSIDKFVKMGDSKTKVAIIVNMLKQGGVEASEEVLTEIANTITDAVVMGSQSDWQGYVDQYIDQGYSGSQAVVKALFNDVAPNVVNAGIGGLISGGGMGFVGSLGSYANYQGQVKQHGQAVIDEGGVDTLKALAMDMAGVKDSTNAKSIGKLASKVDSNASAKNVGRLSIKVGETVNTQNKSDVQNALTEKGLSKKDAARVAEYLTSNETLTDEQQAEVKDNEKIAEVVKELVNNKDSAVNQRKFNMLAARLGVDTKNSKVNGKATSVDGVSLKNDVDVTGKVSEEGKTTKISTGEVITIDKNDAIAKVETVDGERVVYYNTDHGLVELTDVSYASEEDGLLFEAFSDMNPAFANAAIKNYDGAVPVQTYIDGMREGIVLYGMHNFQAVGKDISRNSDLAELSEADQKFALKLGREYAKMNAEKAESDLKTAIKNAAEKAEADGDTSAVRKKSRVRFEDGVKATTKAQKRVAALAYNLSKAIGIDIVFYDARYTTDNDGKGANGYFDPKDNSIHLDLQNAMTDSKTIVFTLSHELVHFIKKWSPAKFNTFANFLMEQYAAHGVSTSKLLANKMAELGETDADKAYEEMIADACERMLLDSNAVVKLMELRKADLELFEKIKLHVLEILNNIRDAFKGVDPNTEEGKALQKMEDVLGKLHEMFEDAAVEAAKNYQETQALKTESVSVSEDGTIQLQMKQYEQTGRSTLLTYLKEQYGDNNANDLIATIDSIYNVMAEIKKDTALSVFGNWQDTEVELDANGHPIFTTSINNGDYELNQDFSRVCKKRRQLNFVLNMLAEDPAFEASNLTKDDFVKINKAIKDHGFEIACALCFVDSKRFRQSEWADSFANTWNDILGSMKADSKPLSRFNFATKSVNMADEGIQIDPSKPISYRKWSNGKATETRHYENLDDLLAKDGNNNVKAIARLLRDNPNLRHEFRGADIIASDGFDSIQRLAPDVRGILDGWGGSSVPKPSSNDAIYDNSILNIDGYNAEKAFAVGGVRMNSFSDFMAHMFFDYAQAFADLSAKKLPMHSYTKELDFARLFGLTGGKVNMSAIAAIRSGATNIDKIKAKADKEAATDFEKSIAGLDISRLAEKLGKSESEITHDDVIQNLDDVDYVWADESIDVKSATLLQSGILYDKLTEGQAGYCYELIRNGQIEEAFRIAGEENVNRGYAKHLGIITVGVSKAHILKLLRDPTIRMVIPYHKSGLNPAVAKALNIAFYDDFTKVQNTVVRFKSGKEFGISSDSSEIGGKKLQDFSFYDFFGKTIDGVLYDGKATAAKYIEWCEKGFYDETVGDYVYYLNGGGHILASELHAKGIEVKPKFYEFASEENYYKLVEDFDCYDTITGEHSAQEAVDLFHDGLPSDYKDVLIKALKAEQKVSDDFRDHLDNKGLRDEIMAIAGKHGYTPSEASKDDGVKKQVKKTSYAPTFYSQMGKVIDDIKMEKIGSASVLNYLKGKGIKNEEIKWSGIEAFLEGKKSVTKQELQEFVAGSMLQIVEEPIGESGTDKKELWDNFRRQMDSVLPWLSHEEIDDMCFDDNGDFSSEKFKDELQAYVDDESISEMQYEEAVEYAEEMEEGLKSGGTRWGQYKLDGGSNYRELVFKMPNSSYSNQMMRVHWGDDAGGILVHARVQDFDVDGKTMLFIEEIQSDWHNEGHSKGYLTKEYEDAVSTYNDLYNKYQKHDLALSKYIRSNEFMSDPEDVRKKKFDWLRSKVDAAQKKYIEANKVVKELKEKGAGDTPNAPFKDTYHEYVLKRLLRMAAEEGYDSIGWTPSEIQSDRWSDEFAEAYRIEYDQDMPKFLRKYGKKWGATVGKTAIDGNGEVTYTSDGGVKYNSIREWFDSSKESIYLVYGDNLKGKLTVKEDGNTLYVENKETGERYPSKLVVHEGGQEVWSMDITDSMKDSVLYEGQPMYQKKRTTNRELLANALEGAAQNDIEKNKLALYKSKIDLIESEQAKLAEVKAEANALRFTKGRTPDETKKMKSLDFEANQIANRINTYDRQLLNLESTAALKNVLQREKELARKRAEKQGKEALRKAKEKSNETIKALMQKNQEARVRGIESRSKTEMRGKIKDIVSDLNTLLLNPTKDKHIPIGLQKPVAAALDIINMDTVGAEERIAKYDALIAKSNDPDVIESLKKSRDRIALQGENLADRLAALKAAYAEIKNSEDQLIKNSHNKAIEGLIDNTISLVGNTSLRDMSLKQLEAVYDMFKAVKATVRNANKMFKEGRQETVTENSEAVKDEVRKAGGHRERILKATKWLKKVGWDMLKPLQAMRVIGSDTFGKLFENVRKGEDTWAVDVNEAKKFFVVKSQQYGYDSWEIGRAHV